MKYPLLLTIIWLLLVLLVNPIGNFPLNDDWQYAYPVKQWIETGQIAMQGRFAPNIILQVVWGYLSCLPFGGFDFSYLRIGVLIIGGATVWLFYTWLKEQEISDKNSFIVSLSLLCSPLFFNLSFSFMTDVPFLFLVLLSLRYFFKYTEEGTLSTLGLAVTAAISAYFIRQPGLLLLPAYAAFIFFQKENNGNKWLTIGLLFALTLSAYWGLEEGIKPGLGIAEHYIPVSNLYFSALLQHPTSVLFTWLSRFLKTYIYLGIFAFPLFPFLVDSMRRSQLFSLLNIGSVLFGNLVLLGLLHAIGKTFPFGGNMWFNWGLGPELLKDVYTLGLSNSPKVSVVLLYLIQYLGQISISLISLLLIKRWNDLSQAKKHLYIGLILFNLLYLAVISIFSYFDRYILLCIASTFFIVAPWISVPPGRRISLSVLPLLCMGYFSFFATKDYLNWNRARLQAFQWMQQEGIKITQMDAGYEYNGWYNYHEHPIQEEGRSFWWITADDYLITFGPVEKYSIIQSFPYYRYLWWKKDQLLVLQKER